MKMLKCFQLLRLEGSAVTDSQFTLNIEVESQFCQRKILQHEFAVSPIISQLSKAIQALPSSTLMRSCFDQSSAKVEILLQNIQNVIRVSQEKQFTLKGGYCK